MGAKEIISMLDLAKKVNSQIRNWTIQDTGNAVWTAKKGQMVLSKKVAPEEVDRPSTKTVNAYHTALLSMPDLAGRVVKPEPVKPGSKANN